MTAEIQIHQQITPWRPETWPFKVSERLGRMLRWIARSWLITVTTLFTLMATRGGIPEPLNPSDWEITAQLAVFAVVVIGEIIAWRWQAIGASIITVGAAALGALAAVEHEPWVALFITLAFFAPAFLYWLDWQRTKSVQTIALLAAVMLTVLGAFGFVASQVYASYHGPSHPASMTVAPPLTLVEWVWSGAPTDNSIRVNASLTRDSDEVYLVISESSDLSDPLTFGPAFANQTLNHRIVTFTADQLDPGTRYHYAIAADGEVDRARAGTFTTHERGPFSYTFAFGSCARTGSNGQVFDTLREADPLFFMHLGDFHYMNIDDNDPTQYRNAYAYTLTRPAQAALYRSVPIIYTWDDHDYGPNDSDSTAPGREAAQQVYREVVPHFPLVTGEGTGAIYHAFTVGRVRYIVTDSRSERSPKSWPDGPNKTMLGQAQKEWLKRELLAAKGQYPLIVWISSVPWVGKERDGADMWSGYATERRELADFVADNEISGVLMLAGDAHMVAIDDGSNSDYSTSQNDGFPVFHASALDNRGRVRGGPYSAGTDPGGGHFGLVTIEDHAGSSITVTLSGRNYLNEEIMSYTFTVPARSS